MSIIDIILNIFRADNTHIYIFWGMIISAFILMIDYRFRVFSPVKRDLKRLKSFFSKTVDSESFSEHIEDINQKIEESRYSTIKNLWSEFQETLTTNKDNDDRLIYYNTKRPDEYFTPEALLKDKGNFNS